MGGSDVVNVRHAVPLEARAHALARLENEGPAALFAGWRADDGVAKARWLSGGSTSVLRAGLETTVSEFIRSRDPSSGIALVHLAQALVLSRLEGEE